MKRDQIISELANRRNDVAEELKKLDDYCLQTIYDNYLKLKEVNPNTVFVVYHLHDNSFNFDFRVTVNTLPYIVQPAGSNYSG